MNATLAYAQPTFYFRRKSKHKTIALLNEPVGHFLGVNLSDEEVAEFKVIYEQSTGLSIDFITAREKATKLMTFAHAIIRYSGITESNGYEPAE